jgi:tyrosinase
MELSLYPADPSRRVFIRGVGLVSLGLVLGTLGGCEALAEKIANRPVRRRLVAGSAAIDDVLDIYAEAVAAMRALGAADPRSWAAQTSLHGSSGGFNFCQHGTSHFFSWHRAYITYFEWICQKITGQPTFGLPYWNWNQDPTMHPRFTQAGSALNHARNNTSVGSNAAFSSATMDTIFADTNFFTFSNQIEGQPHNTAHVLVGQDMVTGASPNDPIFWAHHCMVDYCWAKWNIELDRDNTDDPTWIEETWEHFVDGDGNPLSVTAGSTVLMPLLTFRYESSAIGGHAAQAQALSAAEANEVERRLRRGAPVRFDPRRRVPLAQGATVDLTRPFSRGTRVSSADFAALTEAAPQEEQIFVRVAYDRRPPANDFFVRVFLNRPDATGDTPTTDPHYAGSFAFFGTDQGHAGHGDHAGHGAPEYLVNVTETIRRLRQRDTLRAGEELSVQLVAVPVDPRTGIRPNQLQLGSVEMLVMPVFVELR